VGVLLFADRGLQADRLLGDLQDLVHLVDRDLHLLGDLLGARLAAELLLQVALGADELVDRLDHVHGDADRARLIRDGAGDRLPNPPGGVGGELVAAPVLELLDRLHQADVALLDEVEELQAAVGVLLGDRDHEAEVGLDQLGLGRSARASPRLSSIAHSAAASRVIPVVLLDLADLAELAADPAVEVAPELLV
jgi:hypothetical protein